MKILYIKNISIGIVLCSITILASCKKFVDLELPPTSIETADVFSNDNSALTAINGLYLNMRQASLNIVNGGMSVYVGLYADEIYNTTASASNYDPFFKDSLFAENSVVSTNFWTSSYQNIYRTNAIIEGLGRSTGVSDSLKRQLLGEIKVIRSLYYFYLVNLFGDVPLVITTDYKANAVMPRTSMDKVYQQIVTDLLDAQSLLKVTYPSTGKVRPNKWTATALLARVYLFLKDWPNAESQASAVISSGTYPLVSQANINTVFSKNQTETIWEIAPANEGTNSAEGTVFNPTSTTARPTFALTSFLINAFEANDKRRTEWVRTNTVSSVAYPYPNKYDLRGSTTIGEYNIVLRSSEQYLIRAEARSQQASITNAAADINVIRNRAGLPVTTAATQTALLDAVMREKRIEFFAEWGHRFLDLKRTEKLDAVLGAAKPGWKSTAALFPIPDAQLNYNVFLTQNLGY